MIRDVKDVYDQDALKRICELPEADFAGAFDMSRVKVSQAAPYDYYYFKDNGSNILAVAHLDTVAKASKRTARFVETEGGPVVFSRALDDRLGAYIILDMLPKLGLKFDVLLTTGEEVGQSTAAFFDSKKKYNWIIEFDRGGTDVVMYQFEDDDSRAAVESTGAVVGDGIFTDICLLEHLGVKAFNWGTGYMEYHYPRSHAFLNDTFDMVAYFLEFHEGYGDTLMEHEEEILPALLSRSEGQHEFAGMASRGEWWEAWDEDMKERFPSLARVLDSDDDAAADAAADASAADAADVIVREMFPDWDPSNREQSA